MSKYENGRHWQALDDDKIRCTRFRDEFLFPQGAYGSDSHLPLAAIRSGFSRRRRAQYVTRRARRLGALGVEGHFHGAIPWLPYHENLTEPAARLVGAKPIEVVVMNTLTRESSSHDGVVLSAHA